MGSRQLRILIILAAVMGTDGVILAAASAHQGGAQFRHPGAGARGRHQDFRKGRGML